MKRQSEVVQELIDELIQYIEDMVNRGHELKEDLGKGLTFEKGLETACEIGFLSTHSTFLSELLKRKMEEFMNTGTQRTDKKFLDDKTDRDD